MACTWDGAWDDGVNGRTDPACCRIVAFRHSTAFLQTYANSLVYYGVIRCHLPQPREAVLEPPPGRRDAGVETVGTLLDPREEREGGEAVEESRDGVEVGGRQRCAESRRGGHRYGLRLACRRTGWVV